MSIDQIAAEALRLPAKERALLAESLWESLADPNAATGMDESASVALAVERDQQIESGQVQAVSHEEMMARLRRGPSNITLPSSAKPRILARRCSS